MTREISLTHGYSAVVDDEDYDSVSQHSWYVVVKGNRSYARSRINKKIVSLHRFIMNPPHEIQIDHIDGDGLNCIRDNMRLATASQNSMNRGKKINNTSGYKGVTRMKDTGKYRVEICAGGAYKHIGLFDDLEEAARAYDTAAKEYHGEFASLNFTDG